MSHPAFLLALKELSPAGPDSLSSHPAPHLPSGLPSPRPSAVQPQAVWPWGCCPPNIPGTFSPLALFPQGQLLCILFSPVTYIYWIVLSARLCAGHPRGLGEREAWALPSALTLLLCNRVGAGSRFPQASLVALDLLPASSQPLAPLPCLDILSGFCISLGRSSDGLPPFTPTNECLSQSRAPCSPVTQMGEKKEHAPQAPGRADVTEGTSCSCDGQWSRRFQLPAWRPRKVGCCVIQS